MVVVNSGLLVDTGYFIALYTERDEHHSAAKRKQGLLERCPIVLPWPVLYETMNTRFVKMYVTRTGGLYVKAHELLRSRKGRERLAAMTKLANTLQSHAKARKGS